VFRFIAAVGCLIYEASKLAIQVSPGVPVTELRRSGYSGS